MEINFSRFQLRITGLDGLTSNERQAIEPIAQELGYNDVIDLARQNGYDSPRDMAQNHSFKNTRDYFLGRGWPTRLSRYDRNGKNAVWKAFKMTESE